MTLIGVGLIIIGLFFASGGIFNWDWFMKKGNLPSWIEFFPRHGARIIMIAWGIVFFGTGLAFVLGVT
jgi:hypothetical protein